MTFYETLDLIMKQDFGGRGLLASLPASPLAAVSASPRPCEKSRSSDRFPGSNARRFYYRRDGWTFRELPTSQRADGSWLRRVSRNRLVFLSASGSGSPLPALRRQP